MKLYEILLEDTTQVQEAPMGMIKTLGNKAMSKLGSNRATGKLSTGTLANQLHNEFQTYLGKTGREATKDAVMGFLSSKGYPTQGAATIINTALKGAGNLADKMKPGLQSAPIDNTPTKTGSFNNQLSGGNANYSMSTGFDPKTMKNTGKAISANAVPAPRKKKELAGKINKGNLVAEAGPGVLPQNIIDKAILKAAQEAEIVNTKQGNTSAQQPAAVDAPSDTAANTASAAAPTSSKGGFGAGLKKGFTGKAASSPDINQLAQRIAAIEKKVGLA